MLHKDTGQIEHRMFRDAPEYLRSGDVLVLNDTKVDARRLRGTRPSGGAVEALLVEGLGEGKYRALVKPGKRMPVGAVAELEGQAVTVVGVEAPYRLLEFPGDPDLTSVGEVPLPPYISERISEESRYDTVYAAQPGSAAAPTAGLHFTPEILSDLHFRGVQSAHVTLHVGIDTFRPVEVENLDEHRMHGERCQISPEAAERINSREGRLIAVGTTSVRTLESLTDRPGRTTDGEIRSSLFIRPGYTFRAVDGMFTNFHLPRTTMLAMISALAGIEAVRESYRQAIAERYRFLSFGDSMLII